MNCSSSEAAVTHLNAAGGGSAESAEVSLEIGALSPRAKMPACSFKASTTTISTTATVPYRAFVRVAADDSTISSRAEAAATAAAAAAAAAACVSGLSSFSLISV